MTVESPLPLSRLTFALSDAASGFWQSNFTAERWRSSFTVEVRRASRGFVGLVPAAGGIGLGEGVYLMTARLPNGTQATRCVQIGNPDLETTQSHLAPDDVVPLGTAWQIIFTLPGVPQSDRRAAFQRPDLLALRNWSKNILSDQMASQSWPPAPLEVMGAANRSDNDEIVRTEMQVLDNQFGSLPSHVIWYFGNPLSSEQLTVQTGLPVQLPFGQPFRVTAPPQGILIAQWQRQRQLALNMVLPVCANSGCTLVGYLVEGEQPRLDVVLDNPDADALVRYLQTGSSAEASTYFTAHAAHALLQEKYDDPIGAVVGAYLLLKFPTGGQTPSENAERWNLWTENLLFAFPTIADTLVIRAEQLARQNKHPEALERLLQIPDRGLPMFSIGLSMAIDRLAFYWDVNRSGDQQPPNPFDRMAMDRASGLLKSLREFGARTLYSSPYLTYSGLNPSQPSSDIVNDAS